MTSLIKRLKNESIWGPNSVHKEDARMRFQLRVGYPLYDLFLITFGVFASIGGTPALRQTFGEAYAQAWGFTLAGAAVAALIGVAFPEKYWRLEFNAKNFIIGLLVIYAVAVILAGMFSGPPGARPDFGRMATGFGVFAMGIPAFNRVPDIARDRKIHGWK